jgi:CheY-like chemotaxis protein
MSTRVLVVDDDEVSRLFLGRALEDAGFEVGYAGDGQVALAMLRRRTFDAVVTDLAMPGLNGLRLIREMRELDYDLPVVAVSGQNADQLLMAEDLGANATLFKPVDREELVATVTRELEQTSDFWNRVWL